MDQQQCYQVCFYMNPQMNLNTSLDLKFENKQQRLTNAININGIQLMINNMSLKLLVWKIQQAADK